MGTRSATKIKLRNAQYKCDICGRRLMTAEALKSHQECVHNVTNKPKTKVTPLKQTISKYKSQTPKIKNIKLVDFAVNKSKSTPSKKVSSSKPGANAKSTVVNAQEETVKPFPVDMANVEYECPKCMKIFPIYFSAHRHIQKSHCVNYADEKVSPNSQHLIKPIVKQLCKVCNKRISETETHVCGNIRVDLEDVGMNSLYVCSGCKQQFISLRLFDLHVAGLHCDGVESMFFPSIKEFQIWKDDMELQMKVRYATFGTYNSKQIYRCTFLPEGSNAYDETTSYFCPSTVAVQEFSKGIQVHFYKDHYNHCFENYVLANKYKKYSLTTLLQNSDGYTQINELKEDETDLYLQFKKLMECIVLDAAKINIATLKILIGKALDMTSVLNNYEEDPDSDSLSTKRVIEDKITWVLGELEGNQGEKRKLGLNIDKTESEPITKRFKTRIYQHNPYQEQTLNPSHLSMLQDSTIKIINSFSLAQPEISKAINELDSENELDPLLKLNEIAPKDRQIEDTPIMLVDKGNDDQPKTDPLSFSDKIKDESPSSFNDSYKDFVVKNFNVTPIPPKSRTKNKTNVSNPKCEPSKIDISPKLNVSKELKTTDNSTTFENGVKPYSPLLKPKLAETGVGKSKLSETNMEKSKLLDTSIDKTKTLKSIPVKTRSSDASFGKTKLLDTSQDKTKSESVPGKARLSEASIGKTKTVDASMGKRKTLESSLGNRKASDTTSGKRKSLESSISNRKASETTSSKTKSLESSIGGKKVLETSLSKTKTLNTSLSKIKTESGANKRRNKSLDTGLSLPKTVDLKYEVKERENDCNILILKI